MIEANSRVAFSRPGKMIRIPSVNTLMYKNLLTMNLSSEILSSDQTNSSFSINALSKPRYLFGVSFVKPVNPANSIELGFHLQKNALIYGNINLDVGIHDVLFRQGSFESKGLNTKGISLFSVISNEKYFDDYAISTHLGFGTGKINEDSLIYEYDPIQEIGIFLGFQFTTPYLKKNGGVSILTEYDGMGLNIGVSIPIIKSYNINLGITHFENFGNFATEDRSGTDWSKLAGNAPAITFSLNINVPKVFKGDDELLSPLIEDGIYTKTDSSILFYDPICTDIVEILRDSIRVGQNMIENLIDHKNMLQHNEAILIDSTRKSLLREKVSLSNQNKAMRHLSRSLRLFYNEYYRDALSEINSAIEANPNLSIAYGRRGSIYFKLGDVRRATLNWNVALQLDPEFTEIYDMLKASNENRLTPVEIGKIQENIR